MPKKANYYIFKSSPLRIIEFGIIIFGIIINIACKFTVALIVAPCIEWVDPNIYAVSIFLS